MKQFLRLLPGAATAAVVFFHFSALAQSTNGFGFTGKEVYPIDQAITQLHVADMDGDGLNDIIVVNNLRAKISLLAPAVQSRKGTYLDVFSAAARDGIESSYADGKLVSNDDPPRLVRSREPRTPRFRSMTSRTRLRMMIPASARTSTTTAIDSSGSSHPPAGSAPASASRPSSFHAQAIAHTRGGRLVGLERAAAVEAPPPDPQDEHAERG